MGLRVTLDFVDTLEHLAQRVIKDLAAKLVVLVCPVLMEFLAEMEEMEFLVTNENFEVA